MVTVFCVFGCFMLVRQSKKQLASYLSKMLIWGLVIVVASVFYVGSSIEWVCNIAYAAFFIGTDWILYYWFLFSIAFCSYKDNWYHINEIFMGIIWVDTLSLLMNPVFQHMYSCRLKEYMGSLFYVYAMHPLFYVHLFFVYFLSFVAFANLISKSITCPEMYRMKYINAFLVAFIVPALDILHILKDSVTDYMVFGFAIASIAIYYSVEYVPSALLNHVMAKMVSNMEDGIIIFDNGKQCIYINQSALKILEIEALNQEKCYHYFEQWCEKHGQNINEEFAYKWIREGKNHQKLYLHVAYQHLLDSKGLVSGSFLVVQNRTVEALNLKKEFYKANYDSLTGIYKRRYFYEQTEKVLRENKDKKFVMICSDIKDFKLINELFGTQRGDEVLIHQANLMRKYVNPKQAVYGRVIEDKFAVCLPKERFNEKMFFDDVYDMGKKFTNHVYRMHIYIGVYEIEDINEPVSVMVDKANMAIQTIKGDYNKVLAYYSTEIMQKHLSEKRMLSEFNEALKNREFCMYLQPQCDVNGEVLGAEALVRWQKPEEGLVPPGQFIPVFEKSGIIYQLDEYIWEEAVKQLKRWKDEGREDLYISVNISAKDLYYTDVLAVLKNLVQKYGVATKNLKLEITETVLATEFGESIRLIDKLHLSGFTIEIDDFGSGYSSLNTLKDIHADILKIDMEFLRETEDKKRSRDILNMIVMLSKKLSMPVIVEGVEKAEQLSYLKEMGCDIFQGYYFSRPIPVSEFNEKYVNT